MLNYDINRAQQAIQFLVDSPYVKHHVKRLRNVVKRPRAMPFNGEAEALNELLVIGRQNTQALENLLEVVDHKRQEKPPYMAAFMAAKRARERKVVQIEELLIGRKLTLDERLHLIRVVRSRWAREKAAHIERCADEYRNQIGTEPKWLQTNQFIKDFWMLKDIELDMLLERTMDELAAAHAGGGLPGFAAAIYKK